MKIAEVSHNDLKPANYLINWPERCDPDISNIQVFLTDFGMADKPGGTPIYCAPENFTDATPGVSDLFSLGRIFTNLISESKALFYNLIFYVFENEDDLMETKRILRKFPIFMLIKSMTEVEKNMRIEIEKIEDKLLEIKIEIITTSLLMENGLSHDILNHFKDSSDEVNQMLEQSKFSAGVIEHENQSAMISASKLLNSKISCQIHTQGYNYFINL